MKAQTAVRHILTSILAASMLPAPAFAGTAGLPSVGPLPSPRPVESAGANPVDPARFGAVPAAEAPVPMLRPAAAVPADVPASATAFTASIASLPARISSVQPAAGDLKEGLQALSDHDATKARAIREGLLPGSLDRDILDWAIALSGEDDVPASEIARTAAELSNWPGAKTLRINAEKALWRDDHAPAEVVRAFSGKEPESPEGAMALAKAWLAYGEAGRARQLVSRVWRTERLDRKLESDFRANFQTLLTRADHKRRMDMLLYAERVTDAGRVAGLAGAKELYAARAAVIRNQGNADRLLAAVPRSDRADAGYRLAVVEYDRKHDKTDEAAQLLLGAPEDKQSLVDPDSWWNERRIVARDLLDQGKPQLAYRVAASHSSEGSASERVEAEFHAGWIALRFLNDPRTASGHFARIVRISNMPLSLSRGYYWLGRAAEAGGFAGAKDNYRRAAHYAATFYGQLAAARLGRGPGSIDFPEPTAAERQRFADREAVLAIRRLEDIGSDWRADILYRDLARDLDSPGELALLSVMAERRGDPHLALQVGKIAYWRGIDAPALAFPVGAIPSDANLSLAGKALAYAIARQESAFNPQARSAVGALGLLQLMPATARSMARKVGVSYSEARLTSDPAYNATLGAHFLGQQIEDFGGSYILTFAAYNAGPRRAKEWIQRFGDPRGKSLDDVIDWVERIPFDETRNYVQRVMENYEVYKVRLGAGFDIERDLRFGRAGS